MTWLSLWGVVSAVVDVQEAEDEAKPVTLQNCREAGVGKGPGRTPVVFKCGVVNNPHHQDKGQELLHLWDVKMWAVPKLHSGPWW